MKNNPIIITSGDPEGVFFEIFFKSLKKKKYLSPLILISSKNILQMNMKLFKFKKKIREIDIFNINKIKIDNKKINLIDVKFNSSSKNLHNLKKINEYINKCYEIAFYLIKKKYTYKLITGPINKKKFLKKKFLGITELISNKFNTNKTGMLIYNKNLSVCPATTHLPLKIVSKSIQRGLIKEKIKLVNNFYLKYLKLKPRIAVTGLNPHCESILKFDEDKKIVKPAVEAMKKKKINVKGPFSADTIFNSKNRRLFDVVIGMYHDQVLGPIKTLYEYDAINITMGLPFLRATPDHGPNKEMAGKNISNPMSLIRALEFLDKR